MLAWHTKNKILSNISSEIIIKASNYISYMSSSVPDCVHMTPLNFDIYLWRILFDPVTIHFLHAPKNKTAVYDLKECIHSLNEIR